MLDREGQRDAHKQGGLAGKEDGSGPTWFEAYGLRFRDLAEACPLRLRMLRYLRPGTSLSQRRHQVRLASPSGRYLAYLMQHLRHLARASNTRHCILWEWVLQEGCSTIPYLSTHEDTNLSNRFTRPQGLQCLPECKW